MDPAHQITFKSQYGVAATALYTPVVCKKKWRFLILLLCLLTSLIVGCKKRTPYNYETPWTVELESVGIKVVLKAPFGVFTIWHKADIDYIDLTAKGLSSMSMDWHYESGMPLGLWSSLPENQGKKDVNLYSNVSPTAQGNNYAVIGKRVYFDRYMDKDRPAELIPKETGPVWEGEATQYKNFDTTWYVIEERSELDGLLITCRNSAFYCRLRGARVTERLGIESLTVPIADVANWRDFQEFVQQKVRAAIVSIEDIDSE